MARPQKLPAAVVAQEITNAKGLLTVAASRLGVAESTVYRYIANYEVCKEAVRVSRERMKDFTMGKLYKAINNDDLGAIKYYLSAQAKDRGFGESVEHTGALSISHTFEDLVRERRRQESEERGN